MTVFLQTFDDAAAQAVALAQAVAQALRGAVARKGGAVLAVSGGRSPVAFFECLSREDADWARVTVTLADERLVPPQHDDSNGRLVCAHLLQNRAAAAAWLPLVDGETDTACPETALAQAQARFRQPDVAVLGMGEDGHTASLFPQAPQLAGAVSPDAPPLVHTTPVTAPHERVGMSLNALLAADTVLLAIQGGAKYAVYRQAAAGRTPALPVSLLLNHPTKDCHVFYAR